MAESHFWQNFHQFPTVIPYVSIILDPFPFPKSKGPKALRGAVVVHHFPGSLASASISGTSSQTYSVTGCSFQAGEPVRIFCHGLG
jgi:hypothetical protein